MGVFAKKLTAAACGLALAAGMVPVPALAVSGLQPGSADLEALSARAAGIDENADAFEDGSIIVVYREGAEPSKKASSGMSAQSVSLLGLPNAAAEVLSEESGVEGGGAALRVELPQGVSVGQAVAAAEADPDVVLAQPNFTYYLLDESPAAADAAASTADTAATGGANGKLQLETSSSMAPATYSGEYPLPDDPLVGIDQNDTSQYPSVPNQWWIHSVNAPRAWSMVHGSDNQVAVAVLDTGISFDHEDLRNNLLADYAYDAYLDEPLTESIDNEEMQHGTHVAGIISAEAGNGLGIAGVSYNAKVLPIRVFHLAYSSYYGYDRAACDDADLIRAYDYLLSDKDGNGKTVAEETGTRVVNMSLGGYLKDAVDQGEDPEEAYDHLFESKIEQAEAAGILTVAAAGNGDDYGQGRTDASYPSDYKAVMSVIALKTDTMRTQWSDHNAMKNISAPGNNVYSTYWTSDTAYKFESGTSMATPLVAGCAALLWAYDPTLTVREVKDALYQTAYDLGDEGFDEYYGWGRVDVGAAVASLGTAAVSAETTTMTRTATQQLVASERWNASATHAWKWSVDDASVARVSESGELTALSVGKVVVTATAADDAAITGRRTIEVTDLAIPGTLAASANPSDNTIALNWDAADAAVWYKVLRATAAAGTTNMPGEFMELETVEAAAVASGESATYIDDSAEPAVLYWYQVVPVGSLDGAQVEGVATTSNRCFYTDKTALKENIDKAETLLETTVTSVDGSEVLANAYWAPASARRALNKSLSDAYGAYMSGTMMQARVDSCSNALADANEAFETARKRGSVKAENALQALPVDAVHVATYGTKLVLLPAQLYAVTGAQGAVSYKAVSAPAGITVAADGAMTVSESTMPGTYGVQVDIVAAGDDVALPKTQTVTVQVQVNKVENGIVAKPKAKMPSVVFNASRSASVNASSLVTVSGAQGAVSYEKASGSAKLSVAKDGKVTVAKGTPVGTYELKVNVTAAGNDTTAAKSVPVAVYVNVSKAANTLAVKAKAPSVSFSASKARTIAAKKAFKVSKAQGALSYKKASGAKALSVNAKSGLVKVAKNTKKGTYSAKVKVTAAGTKNYQAGSKTVTLKVKVK